MERRRLPRGGRPSREMFFRWAKGRVCDVLLRIVSKNRRYMLFQALLLHQVKNRDSVSDWGEETGPIRTEKQVSLAVDSPQKVGELQK
jgi:hypothetical protein